MDLKSLCENKLVNMIDKLPGLIKEKIIGMSIEQIRKKEREKILEEFKKESEIVIGDLTSKIILSRKSGCNFSRPSYTENIDDDMYKIYLNVSENFANMNENILYNNIVDKKRKFCYFNLSDSSDSDDSD